MIICEKCFKDSEIIQIINKLGINGTCNTCNSKNVHIYDTDKHKNLDGFFDNLISIYSIKSSLPSNYPKDDLHMLIDEIKTLNIFKITDNLIISKILYCLSKELFEKYRNNQVGISQKYETDFLEKNLILKHGINWEQFVHKIKYENRFHIDCFNLDILKIFCGFMKKEHKKGTKFYRCRISDDHKFKVNEMGAPPIEASSSGRTNPQGISRLYLSNDENTCIVETRPIIFDTISIGTFILQKDISVIDFKSFDKISPFIYGYGDFLLQYIINKEILEKISFEITKPASKKTNYLDYIPTQYISEFIQAIKEDDQFIYDGLEYKSTINDDGYNLSIFDPTCFKCTNVKHFKIEGVEFKRKDIGFKK